MVELHEFCSYVEDLRRKTNEFVTTLLLFIVVTTFSR